MNILFYTTNEVAPQYGGVERVTANIANALTTFYNVNCYSAYKYNIDKSFIVFLSCDEFKNIHTSFVTPVSTFHIFTVRTKECVTN